MEMRTNRMWIGMMVLLLGLAGASWAEDLGTVFSYQGRLETAGSPPLNGSYDFKFQVYDTPSVGAGTPIGELMEEPNVPVTEGIFTVQLNPDPNGTAPNLFNGKVRYLEIAVRKTGSAESHFTISPRQRIHAAPYAITASSARWLRGPSSTEKVVYVHDSGNVGIGTTDPGANKLKVEGDINLTGALNINNKRPIKFVRYGWDNIIDDDWTNQNSIDYDTHILCSEYAAAIVGFSSGWWDINESGAQSHISVYVESKNGTWHIRALETAHGSDESYPDWMVWVMYVHMSLVEGLYGY